MTSQPSATTLSGATANASAVDEPKTIELDELEDVWQAYLKAKAQAARFTQLRDDLQKIVQTRMGDAEFGLLNGVPVASYKKSLRIFVSQQLVKQHHPDVALECQDITEVRTFRVLVA
jgi:hypothetical protein